MIKKFKDFVNESKTENYQEILKLHNDLVEELKKNKKIEIVKDFGPEPNKYSSKEIVSDFHLKGYEEKGFRDGYNFSVTYNTRTNKISLFMYNVGYSHNLEKNISAKEILKIIKNKTKKETELFK